VMHVLKVNQEFVDRGSIRALAGMSRAE